VELFSYSFLNQYRRVVLEAASTVFRTVVPCRKEPVRTLQQTDKHQIMENMELLCHEQQLHCRC